MRSRPVHSLALALLVTLLAGCSGDDPDPEVSDPPTSAPVSTTAATTPTPPATSAAPVPTGAGTLETFSLEGETGPRRYDVYVPPTGDGAPRPLVVVLPGTNVDLDQLREFTGFPALADAEGFLVVYAEAGPTGFDTRLCCNATDIDVEFVRSVIATVDRTWPVDPQRVYATGFSAGAAMSYKLAVRAPDVFAAIAAVSGGFYPDPTEPTPGSQVPAEPPSVLTVAGGADPDHDDIVAGVERWRTGAECGPPSDAPVPDDPDVTGSTAACRNGSQVDLYDIADMNHSWPGGGGDSGYGDPTVGFDASAVIWTFFSAHSIG